VTPRLGLFWPGAARKASAHRGLMRACEENRITDEARRRVDRELDLEEARESHMLANVGITDSESTG
jgi:hypothetical protein